MEIRNLESFIQVAELGSFTKAAESLGYTQSSVSTQIRQLEKELGIPLFERINHRVRLTEKGKEILNLTHELFRTAEAIKKNSGQSSDPFRPHPNCHCSFFMSLAVPE